MASPSQDPARAPEVEGAASFIERKQRQFARELERQRSIEMKDIGRQGRHHWVREAWTFRVQCNYPQKVFVVERLRLLRREGKQATEAGARVGELEYRIGYYTVGRIGRKAGRWTWGQYCPMIPAPDLLPLIEQAREEGTIST